MKPLKALIVEDSESDEELLLRQLAKADYDVQSIRVQTAADMEKALAERDWDIILSDYAMPGFTGLDALRVLKESGRDIPLIIISGTIGEDIAVEAMRVGVNDYLIKGNLTRLAPAIERELENAASRRAQQQAEETLRLSEASLANAQRIAHLGNFDWDIQHKQIFWSDEVYRILNLPKGSLESSPELVYKYIHPDDKKIANSITAAALSKAAPYEMEIRIVRPGGEERIVCLIGEVTFDKSGEPLRLTATVQDITERKTSEAQMRLMKSAIDSIAEGIVITDAQKPDNPIIYTNAAFENVKGYTLEEIKGQNCRFLQGAETNQQTVDEIREAINQETSFRGEILNYRKNGESFWNDLSISPVFDQSGRLTNFVGVQQDISKRKQAEEILRASEAKIRQLVDSSIIGITTTRLDGSILEANDVFLKTVGYSRQDLLAGKLRWDEMTPPEIFWQDERAREQLFKFGYSIPREKEYIRKDGSRVPVMVGGTLLKGTEDTVLAFVLDFSEQKRVEEEKKLLTIQIERQHERLNNVIANVPGVVWEAWGSPDAATQRIDFVSDYVETMLGYTVEEWVSTPNFWLSIVHPEDKERIAREATERFLTGNGYTRQFRWIAKDGHIVCVESQATIIRDESGQPIGLRGINIDITERRRLEAERTKLLAELASEKARLQHIFDNSPSFIVSMHGPDFVFEMANPAYYQLVGQRDLIGLPASEALPEVMTQGLSEIIRQVYNTGEPFIGNEVPVRLQQQDGSELEQHYVNFVYMPLREADDSISGIISYGVDVTEQVLSRIKIQESEERYRFLFDSNPLPMWAFDLETLAFLSVNDAAIAHYGYTREEFLNMTVKDIRPPEDIPAFLQNVAIDIPGIKNAGVRRHTKKDGTLIDVEVTTNQLIFDGRKAKLVLVNDVTERKLADRKIRESEERYRIVAETANDVIITIDEHSSILFVNSAMERTLGYKSEELIGKNLSIIVPERHRAAHSYGMNRYMQTGRKSIPWSGLEIQALHRDGVEIQIEISFSEYHENNKRLFTGVFRDITERKQTQQKILESEEKYRSIVETANEGIWLTDLETRATYVNRQMAEMLGYTVEEMLGRPVFDFIFEEDVPVAKRKYEQRKAGKSETGEFRLRRKDGSEIITLYNTTPRRNQDGEIVGFLSMRGDITERKRAERMISESEEKYRSIVETANEGILLNDIEGRTVFVNRQMSEMLGYTADDLLGRTIFNFIFEEDFADTKQKIEQRKQGKAETIELRLRRKDGSETIFLHKSSPTRNEAGEITGFLTMNTDITERKKAERELQNAEAKYRSLVESSPAIVYLAEPHPPFSPIYVSPNITRFGYTAEEWFDRPDMWISLIHDEDRARVLRATENAVAQGEETDMEYRVVAKDGTIVWLHDKGRFVLDEQGNKTGWQGMMVDITKNKELEDQLRQSQKLESIGRLAGGIAHDFNNMLTAINGYSDLTLRRMKADDPLRGNIEEIKKAGERSAELTHQLLAFSRQQVLKPKLINLNDVVEETSNMLQRMLGEDIQFVTVINPKLGSVMADFGQLSQIVMNLVVNARDAMPRGGKLTIETKNVFLDPNYTSRHAGVLPGAYVMLAVCDTGIGMSEEIQRHVFEPFFTTKEVGQGTGLGLATVYGIVKQSGGNIEIYSEEAVGTTFKIYLPRVAGQAELEGVEENGKEIITATEKILLVEDEDIVRALAKQVLEDYGYTVIEARNGLEALKICEVEDCNFDLLMTDVVMPQMGGRELADLLKEKLPELKILFISGYTDDAVIRHGVIEVGTNFIQKPFTPDALAKKIRELLDNSAM